VARVASLLSALGAERDARSKYCAFVRKRVETSSRSRRLLCEKDVDSQQTNSDAKKLSVCSGALSELFEHAAGEMTKRFPEAIEYLGASCLVSVGHAIEDGVGLDAARLIEKLERFVFI
jgi:hypothetical protein